ncbi:hypothetical protein [Nocardia africana]|uniref:hypothetical protein n=1 Tax=Nocardia africana TaxID=134964 RepID=UPI0012F4EAD9|nr:hypothetical protein [Nocardia africana]
MIVGDPGVVATSGDVDVVELAAIVVRGDTVVDLVVAPVAAGVVSTGAAGVVRTCAVGVVIGTVVVAVPGSAVTVTVDLSTGAVGAVDIGGGTIGPESGMLGMIWIERLAVAEKLAPADAAVEVGGASVVVAVVDSGAADVDSVVGAGPVPGSVASTAGTAPGSAAASVLSAPSPGTEISPGASDVALRVTTPLSLETAPQSTVCTVGRPEYACASFLPTGGLESARTTSVIPIAVVINAMITPAREIWCWYRSPHHRIPCRDSPSISASVTRFSLPSTVPIPLLLSSSGCADRWKPAIRRAMRGYRVRGFRPWRRDPRHAAVAGEFSAVHRRG